ncbi:MAG: flagellar basal body-associated FliL family protein [Dehalococcoidia bacterium]|nr:flagellar basal body-associated FliL family protein [Dehalococcoidia bacterium]
MKDKKVLAGGAVLLIAAFWFYIKPHYMDAKPAPVFTAEQLAAAPRPTVRLEERVLNLKAPATSPNYVKAVIALEFTDPDHKWMGAKGEALTAKNEAFAKELEPEMHRVWDVITSIVGTRTVEQVAGGEGRDALKKDLVTALNADLTDHKVETVFFVTFITQ